MKIAMKVELIRMQKVDYWMVSISADSVIRHLFPTEFYTRDTAVDWCCKLIDMDRHNVVTNYDIEEND